MPSYTSCSTKERPTVPPNPSLCDGMAGRLQGMLPLYHCYPAQGTPMPRPTAGWHIPHPRLLALPGGRVLAWRLSPKPQEAGMVGLSAHLHQGDLSPPPPALLLPCTQPCHFHPGDGFNLLQSQSRCVAWLLPGKLQLWSSSFFPLDMPLSYWSRGTVLVTWSPDNSCHDLTFLVFNFVPKTLLRGPASR